MNKAAGLAGTQTSPGSRAFLGLGGTVDAEVICEPRSLQQLTTRLHISLTEVINVNEINTQRDLICWLLNQMRQGRGGEKYVCNADVISWAVDQFPHSVTLGGTDIRSAAILGLHGISSIAHVAATDATMLALKPPHCELLSAGTTKGLIPHLIMQYAAGLRVEVDGGVIEATKADRVIFANDPANEKLPFAEGIEEAITESPVVLLSTLNVIQNTEILENRLARIINALTKRANPGPVLWEDAGYHRPDIQLHVATTIGPYVDIFGTNAEEITTLLSLDKEPQTFEETNAALAALSDLTGSPNTIMHSSKWAIVRGPQASELACALDYGNAVASTRFKYGDNLTLDQIRTTQTLPRNPEVLRFADEISSHDPLVRIAPNYPVTSKTPTTIGLGDAFLGGILTVLCENMGNYQFSQGTL